jgi:hypothetical protein
MDTKKIILWLALLSAFLFSGNGYAIPMLMGQAHTGDAKGSGAGSISVAGAGKSGPAPEEMQAFAHLLPWSSESSVIGALLAKYYGPFGLLHGFHLPFGFSAQDEDMEKNIIWASSGPDDDVVISGFGFEYDDMAIAEFFATLGIDIMDWRAIVENHPIPGHDATPSPDSQAIARSGPRKECVQRRDFARKSEGHDNDCFGAGGLANVSSNAGRSRITAIANGSSLNPNSRNSPVSSNGFGGGVPGGGGATPNTSPGSNGGNKGNGGGGAPDTGATPGTGAGTGEGEIGGGHNEVRPVPEPGTGILLLLGFACMYCMRSQRRRIVLKDAL